MWAMRILLAEDERDLNHIITLKLRQDGYSVDGCHDGEEALEALEVADYDAVILDIMMPEMSGIEVLRELRKKGCRTPILLLTAKSQVEDKIEGLDAGADDYLPKPFEMGELLARIRAMLRRREEFTPDILTCGNLSLNMQSSQLSCGDQSFTLPRLEYRLMEQLMLNRGIYLSSDELMAKVWGYDSDAEIGAVWVYISYLRKRLTALGANAEIKVKRGTGYTLEETK